MADFLEQCLQKYFEATRWYPEQQYSSLLKPSRDILDFAVPSGINFHVSKSISDALKSNYALSLPFFSSYGILYSSIPLDSMLYHHPDASSHKIYQTSSDSESKIISSYFLYGRILRDARLNYILARRLSSRTLLTVEGSSSWQPGASYINYLISTNRNRWGHEFSFSSESAMFGFRWLRRAFQYWQWGGEIYYLAQGMGGGMSFGFKRNSPHSIFTLTLHPLLWHLSTTYSTQVLPGLHTSCRYDYNAYSYESDLSLGVALHPLPITFNSSCFRFCVGVKKGLSLMYQHNLDPVAVKFGFVSNEKQTGMGIEFSYVAS